MSTYTIEVDDNIIKEQMCAILNRVLDSELRSKYTSTGKEISYAVGDLIKSNESRIIDRVVEIAATKIARKALPKLIEKLGSAEVDE